VIMSKNPFAKFAGDLRRGSAKIPTKVVPSFVDLLANRILTRAKRNAPVQTGALRASGRIEMGFTPQQRIVSFGGVGTMVDYAKVIEFGRFSRAPFPPRPYLRPALIQEMKDGRKDVKNALEKSLDEYRRHYGSLTGGMS